MVYAIYDERIVTMDYIVNPADRFKRAAQRIVDNGFDGYVVDDQRAVFEVTRSRKTAKRCDGATSDRVLAELTTLSPLANPQMDIR